jgi:hypothetical protein
MGNKCIVFIRMMDALTAYLVVDTGYGNMSLSKYSHSLFSSNLFTEFVHFQTLHWLQLNHRLIADFVSMTS